MNSENSSSKIVTIRLNSGNILVILVIVNGLFIKLTIRKQKNSVLNPVILISLHGTSARRVNAMTSL